MISTNPLIPKTLAPAHEADSVPTPVPNPEEARFEFAAVPVDSRTQAVVNVAVAREAAASDEDEGDLELFGFRAFTRTQEEVDRSEAEYLAWQKPMGTGAPKAKDDETYRATEPRPSSPMRRAPALDEGHLELFGFRAFTRTQEEVDRSEAEYLAGQKPMGTGAPKAKDDETYRTTKPRPSSPMRRAPALDEGHLELFGFRAFTRTQEEVDRSEAEYLARQKPMGSGKPDTNV